MSRKAADKLAQQRLSVLELADTLGNVSAACRQRGVSRTQFCEYKRRFQTHSLEGLKDLSLFSCRTNNGLNKDPEALAVRP